MGLFLTKWKERNSGIRRDPESDNYCEGIHTNEKKKVGR